MAPVDPSPSCEWPLLHGLGDCRSPDDPNRPGFAASAAAKERSRVAEGRSRADGGASQRAMDDLHGREGERAGSIGG